MKESTLTELVYDKINLSKSFESCFVTLGTNVIQIKDKDGQKFVLTIEEVE